uniref:tetratricopeptide repeat protein n=1 Tax=Treponema zioleckii TaxID=331680 RepID=UPI0018D60C03
MKKLFGVVLLVLGACVFAQALTRVEFFEKVKENFEIENYEKVLTLSDTMLLQKMSKTQEAEIDYVKAQAYYMLNRFDLALEYAEKSLAIQKKSPDVYDLKGQIFIALYKKNDDSENLKKAIVAFDESLKINQRFLGSHLYRGLARYYLFSSQYSE